MSKQLKGSRVGGHGSVSPEKQKTRSPDARSLPGINLQEVIAERNWTSLGGLVPHTV